MSSTEVPIRCADTSDAAEIARIYNYYVDHGGATFETEHWDLVITKRRVQQPAPEGWYVAGEPGSLQGWASARRYSDRFGYRFCCESAIYVDPDFFGFGIADRLQERLHEHCHQNNIHHAVAKIIADNHRSLAFHRRHGYEMVGVQKEIGHIDGQWVDVAILQKIFDND